MKTAMLIVGLLVVGGVVGLLLNGQQSAAQDLSYLSPDQVDVLEETFETHMNYFLSDKVIPRSGIPCTAYKAGDRARFGYSNPTEWGYAMQAWIAAAERDLVSVGWALERLTTAVATIEALQLDPTQTYNGLPYPFYKVVDSEGHDLPLPQREPDSNVPSGDDALLYSSLVIVQGWATARGHTGLAAAASDVSGRMDFRPFLRAQGNNLFIAHTLNADSDTLSPSNWDVFADEGGMVAWVAFANGSITLEEFKQVTRSQHRRSAHWTADSGETYVVQEAAWFNAMFPWAVRSLGGFPIQIAECPENTTSLFARESLVPTAGAHLALGDQLGIDHPAFSDAMSQARGDDGLVGWIQSWYMPPNLPGQVLRFVPTDVTPHALFVPLNAITELPEEQLGRWIEEVVELMTDEAEYYHATGEFAYGFEVTASPRANDLAYAGANDGRPVFETLSAGYTVLSLFNALQLSEGGPTFTWFARQVPGYDGKLQAVLAFLYP